MKLEKATIAAGITGVEIMILEILKNRFFQNMTRHPDLGWEFVEARLNENKEVLEVLRLMEESGGEALQKRKKNPPKGSAVHQAKEMGVSLLTEELYRRLQELGPFDLKTSSWIATPDEIRSKGGALFCERRYDAVFTFHNGADSYYSVRGWRGYITL